MGAENSPAVQERKYDALQTDILRLRRAAFRARQRGHNNTANTYTAHADEKLSRLRSWQKRRFA